MAQDLVGDPSPEVVAVYLRPTAAVPSPVARADVPAVDASLIDTITRIVCEMLETHVRESVTAAVLALAPRMVVSLGPDNGGDAQVRSRPRRVAPRHE